MNKFEKLLAEKIQPLAQKLQEVNILAALMEGFIRTSPVTLGYALLSIITSFMGIIEVSNPAFVEGTGLMEQISLTDRFGLGSHFTALGNATTAILAVYAIHSIATAYSKRIGSHEMTSSLVSMASFFILIPFTETEALNAITGMEEIQYGINLEFLNAKGLLLAIIIALAIPQLVKFFDKTKLTLNLPDSVPSMISQSLEPMISTGLIFVLMLGIRLLFAQTSYGNAFDFMDQLLSKPVMALIGSPLGMIGVVTLINFLWFFGIHNAVLQGPLSILSITLVLTNLQASMQGQPMPFVSAAIAAGAVLNAGALPGLVILMLFSKSERYKSITKLSLIPAIFNITEPIMFGLPIVLNPIFFIPQVFAPFISGLVAWFSWSTFLGQYTYNPAMSLLPFVIPKPISSFLSSGFKGVIMWVIITGVSMIIWYPFYKVADKKALEEERLNDI